MRNRFNATAHAAQFIAACAVVFCAVSCDAPLALRPAIVTFHTDPARPAYGAVDVAPIERDVLRSLARSSPTLDQWHSIFPVTANDSAGLPMLGAYSIVSDTLRFTPRFAPVPGNTYYARFNDSGLREQRGTVKARVDASGSWRLAAPSGVATTVVEAVYPSADTVPMNLLRMYIQFSAPMSVGDDGEKHVRLLDEAGKVVPNAFLIAAGGQELWDRDHRRMTVFFDPGRIKRDLTPHDQLGLPLQQGHSYRLVIDTMWHDARGLPLLRGFEKKFRVGAIDRGLVKTSAWRVTSPKAGTRDPLVIVFPRPLDHALAQRMLAVKRANGVGIGGAVVIGARETEWRFTPDLPWVAGDHAVIVDTELEDLAGNNLRRSFDVMPADTGARGVNGPSTRVPFSVR